MHLVREKIQQLLAGGDSVNRRLVVLVGLATAAVVAILVAINSAKPVAETASVTTKSNSTISAPDYFVHISGEVNKPGVYQLVSTARLFEAVFAAGGFTDKADQASINLARQINDGEQIIVLAKGQTGSDNPVSPLVSLNRATASQLEGLPGIGPTLAARLIDWRTTNGGFKKIEDLKRVSGFGVKLFAQLKNLVTL